MAKPPPRERSFRVWDLPLRLFHWLLVLALIGSITTVQLGGLWMDYHVLFGYAIGALLLFRLAWGVLGSHHARFANFVGGPARVWAYLRGQSVNAGHSPLASWSVMAMLLALAVQVVTGLFATDGILTEGPLARYVSAATSDTLTGIHQINKYVVLALIALHLLAIGWYSLIRRQPLVRAMITGNKPARSVPERSVEADDNWRLWLRALLLALLAAGLMIWIVSA